MIADYDTAFGAGTLTCTFLESRSMTGKFVYKPIVDFQWETKVLYFMLVFFSPAHRRGEL